MKLKLKNWILVANAKVPQHMMMTFPPLLYRKYISVHETHTSEFQIYTTAYRKCTSLHWHVMSFENISHCIKILCYCTDSTCHCAKNCGYFGYNNVMTDFTMVCCGSFGVPLSKPHIILSFWLDFHRIEAYQ